MTKAVVLLRRRLLIGFGFGIGAGVGDGIDGCVSSPFDNLVELFSAIIGTGDDFDDGGSMIVTCLVESFFLGSAFAVEIIAAGFSSFGLIMDLF